MANDDSKLGVSVDCVIKSLFDKSLTTDLKKLITTTLETAIDKSGKLEVVDKPTKGFSLTATLELTKNDKIKPPQLEGKISIAILGVGMPASTINLQTPGSADPGSNPRSAASQAKALVEGILDRITPKAVQAMLSKVPKS
jgi:hypothetical protein